MIVGIYHKDCIDGTTAAAVLLKKFPDAKVYPMRHRFEPADLAPVLEVAQLAERIYTVDCGIAVPELLAQGFAVTTIDHHAGAKKEFEALARENPHYEFVFDNDKSGASLTWTHLFPSDELPEVITLVQDQDLWTWKFGDRTRDVNYCLSQYLNQPEVLIPLITEPADPLQREGVALARFAKSLIDRYVEKIKPIRLRIGEHAVPAYNVTDFQSECGAIFSAKNDSAVALFTIKGKSVSMSFRGTGHDNPTCLTLATILGGGGHENSSGADVPLATFIDLIIRDA